MTYRVASRVVVLSGMGWMSSGGLCYGGVSSSGGCVLAGVSGVRLMNWNSGFSSATYCSLINNCCVWYSCIYRFSVMFMCQPFLHVFISCILSCIGAYSCWLFKMCRAYADFGSLFFIYLVCSIYLVFRFLPVWPT
jgi:hypothetical protein